MLRVLVCGGRDYDDAQQMQDVLSSVNISEICHGGARGADSLAGEYAKQKGIVCRVYPADWNKHGKSAGYVRNIQMADEFLPDMVIAFPGGKGTKNMIDIAQKRGIKVCIILKRKEK